MSAIVVANIGLAGRKTSPGTAALLAETYALSFEHSCCCTTIPKQTIWMLFSEGVVCPVRTVRKIAEVSHSTSSCYNDNFLRNNLQLSGWLAT